MKQPAIKWQSGIFPKLILSEDHYQVMRRIYPHVESFQREMERLEGWLYANPDRVPKKNWMNQINNWMKIADEIAVRERTRRLVSGRERPRSHREAAESIGEIFKRLAEDEQSKEKREPPPGALFDEKGQPVKERDA